MLSVNFREGPNHIVATISDYINAEQALHQERPSSKKIKDTFDANTRHFELLSTRQYEEHSRYFSGMPAVDNNEGAGADFLLAKFVRDDDFGVVEWLVEDQKASLSNIDQHGYTALLFAAQLGNIKMMGYLIDRGASVNQAP
jgi:ankyrin repeat protein